MLKFQNVFLMLTTVFSLFACLFVCLFVFFGGGGGGSEIGSKQSFDETYVGRKIKNYNSLQFDNKSFDSFWRQPKNGSGFGLILQQHIWNFI